MPPVPNNDEEEDMETGGESDYTPVQQHLFVRVDECTQRIRDLDGHIKQALREYQGSNRSPADRQNYIRKRNALYSQRKYHNQKLTMSKLDREIQGIKAVNTALSTQNKHLEQYLVWATAQIDELPPTDEKLSAAASASISVPQGHWQALLMLQKPPPAPIESIEIKRKKDSPQRVNNAVGPPGPRTTRSSSRNLPIGNSSRLLVSEQSNAQCEPNPYRDVVEQTSDAPSPHVSLLGKWPLTERRRGSDKCDSSPPDIRQLPYAAARQRDTSAVVAADQLHLLRGSAARSVPGALSATELSVMVNRPILSTSTSGLGTVESRLRQQQALAEVDRLRQSQHSVASAAQGGPLAQPTAQTAVSSNSHDALLENAIARERQRLESSLLTPSSLASLPLGFGALSSAQMLLPQRREIDDCARNLSHSQQLSGASPLAALTTGGSSSLSLEPAASGTGATRQLGLLPLLGPLGSGSTAASNLSRSNLLDSLGLSTGPPSASNSVATLAVARDIAYQQDLRRQLESRIQAATVGSSAVSAASDHPVPGASGSDASAEVERLASLLRRRSRPTTMLFDNTSALGGNLGSSAELSLRTSLQQQHLPTAARSNGAISSDTAADFLQAQEARRREALVMSIRRQMEVDDSRSLMPPSQQKGPL